MPTEKRYSLNVKGDLGGYINHGTVDYITGLYYISKEELQAIDSLSVGENLVLNREDNPAVEWATIYRMS